ncbi:sulfatase family protein [Microbispora sp. ATCC PTA-5024]|uniref:sulfatase family protein n=1 Tax=Microbispora sp. ATCC PTA-5024 TaxID=316330 RepID=UPI0003DC1528|nr:sulfatase [Microbispora sp. ATCC PTA-5024]ETK37321.1 multidrug transporter [Microbispora sp. ATCC PTA-5024]
MPLPKGSGRRWLALALALVACLALTGAARGAPDPPGRPNIVLILTDDLDTSDLQHFPNIANLLVRQGASFSRFFVTNPWCCPSRSSLLRSQYVHSHHVESNRAPTGGFPRFRGMEGSTVGTWMHDAGYRTGLMGKYLNQYPKGAPRTYVPPGWDEWDVPVTRLYQEYGYALNENGALRQYGHAPGDYLEDVLSAKAGQFVSGPGPFFLYLAPVAPHLPAHYAPRHADAFAGERAPRTASFDQADLSAEPRWLRERPPLSARETARIDRVHQDRLRAMLGVDDMVGALVSALARAGRLDDTYIFFTSDNGFHLGQHRLRPGKTTPFEEDIRVPMVVRGPGVAPGATLTPLTSTVDLAPTFAELGGAAVPWWAEGRSLVPLLRGADVPWRDALLVEFSHAAYSPSSPPSYAVLRTGRYAYVQYATGERQLYDLWFDPAEMHNLAPAAGPGLLAQLSARLALLRICMGAGCRIVDGLGGLGAFGVEGPRVPPPRTR